MTFSFESLYFALPETILALASLQARAGRGIWR